MCSAGSRPEAVEAASSWRRRPLPTRVLGNKLIVARPSDGAPVVLAPTAALVWQWLDDWIGASAIDDRLERAFPDIAEPARRSARSEIVSMLELEGLVERR
jgi:hypothetical protein